MIELTIGCAILSLVFAYLTININNVTDDNRFFPLTIVFLIFTFVSMTITSTVIMDTWNGTLNDTAGGILNETTMPKNSGDTMFWFSVMSIIILFAVILIMVLKDSIGVLLKI